jgi:hypothetical protein
VGLVCNWIFQPVIRLIQVVVAVVEYVLVQICRLIEQVVETVVQVLKYVCNTVVRTVCNAVCNVVCGICDFFCGLFGCSCGCRDVCNNVCRTVTDVVCGWTYVVEVVLRFITKLVCEVVVKALITFLNVVMTLVTMVLTWACSFIDIFIRWLICWTYVAELWNSRAQRRFRVAPKIVRNDQGHSDWFVYVNNGDEAGNVDQLLEGYILSDEGKPLTPVSDDVTGVFTYYEVLTRGDRILDRLRTVEGEHVPGRPLLYYPSKVMEIASHLFGDIFAGDPGDDGRGTAPEENLLTYSPNVQAWLADAKLLGTNNYNAWPDKYATPSSSDYFGDRSIADIGVRVDTDDTCSRPTNTFLHLIDDIAFTPPSTDVAETMTCGAGQTLTLDQTDFLLQNKHPNGYAVTTYFVTRYDASSSSVGCNDVLGYTNVTFQGTGMVERRVLPYEPDTNRMMALIVRNVSGRRPQIVRVAETYLHELGHQCGQLHDEGAPDCHDATALNITKVMHPGGSIRRALTRIQWCMIRNSYYVTRDELTPFLIAPELPDSGSTPSP